MAAYTTIDDPSAHFQIATWAGSGSTQSITFDGNSDMQPDWVWTKPRTIAFNHALMDSSRGVGSSGKVLVANSANAEFTIDDYVTALNSDGFSVGAGDAGFNASNDTYVSWCWKANGGTTSSNTDGSLTSTVQANTTAGFSIVTYSNPSTNNNTIGHGLGVQPEIIIFKNTVDTIDWYVASKYLSNYTTKYLELNTNDAEATHADGMNSTAPTSSVFSVGGISRTGDNGNKVVAYCFAAKQGYSKFGTYVGNGNSDGPFIYTGFKPAFVIVKATGGTTDWRMNGPDGVFLSANSSAAVYDSAPGPIDRVSNGFKIRGGDDLRANGGTFIYMAWAKNPFVTSTGVPTTASSTGPAT